MRALRQLGWRAVPTFRRCLSSTPPQIALSEKKSSPPGILSKYSVWLPLATIGGAVALSKELLILNEEVLIVFTFSATVYALYSQVGGMVSKMLDERSQKIANDLSQVLDQSITAVDDQIQSAKKLLTFQKDMDDIFALQRELMGRYLAAIPNSLQANLNSQITSRLAMIADKERQFLYQMQAGLADASADAVRQKIGAGSQKELIIRAIKSLQGGSAGSKTDMIRSQFTDYFVSFSKKVASQTGKDYKLTADQKKEWSDALDDLIRRDPNLKGLDVQVPDTVKL